MNQILKTVDSWSFKKIFSLMGITTILLFIPFVWWAAEQRSTIGSRASLEPTGIPTPVVYGELPASQPQITEVSPYFGKIGDEVVVRGVNLGVNPPMARLSVGGVPVTEVIEWTDDQIIFTIPTAAISGNLELNVASYSADFFKPMTVYSEETQTQVSLSDGRVTVLSPVNVAKVAVWTKGESSPKLIPFPQTTLNSWLSPERYEQIEAIALYDSLDQLISFFIDPLEML